MRIKSKLFDESLPLSKFQKKLTILTAKRDAGYGELQFINDFSSTEELTERHFLLGWVFATLLEQHLFAFELATAGQERYGEDFFGEMIQNSIGRIKKDHMRLLPRIPEIIARKLRKLVA